MDKTIRIGNKEYNIQMLAKRNFVNDYKSGGEFTIIGKGSDLSDIIEYAQLIYRIDISPKMKVAIDISTDDGVYKNCFIKSYEEGADDLIKITINYDAFIDNFENIDTEEVINRIRELFIL